MHTSEYKLKKLLLKGDIILWTAYKEYSQEGENIHLGISCLIARSPVLSAVME